MNRNRKILLLGIFVVCVLIIFIGTIGSKENEAMLFDEEDREIARVTYTESGLVYECEESYRCFVDTTIKEAVALIMEQEDMTEAYAEKWIVENQMQIKTAFQKDALEKILYAYEKNENIQDCSFAVVLGDIDGKIYACYSVERLGQNKNMVLEPTYAASAFKPLSVYAQVIESGQLLWSDKILDAPYISEKTDGSIVEIPQNAGNYTNAEVFLETAVKESLNTVPIRILKEYSVQKSCDFLTENFGIVLDRENYVRINDGEDEILANIALGYTNAGVTPKDLFAYYQIFANGGTYQPAYTILRMETKDGLYYQHEDTSRRVISEETAYIVNRLLKQVVTDGGTGELAQIDGMDICGKTGTSNDFADNWFVGVTPQYVGAVWYGYEELIFSRDTNESVVIFRDMVSQIEELKELEFEQPSQVEKKAYCQKTGLLATESCEEILYGYYKAGQMPEQCDCR